MLVIETETCSSRGDALHKAFSACKRRLLAEHARSEDMLCQASKYLKEFVESC
jgi:hypothetical protein